MKKKFLSVVLALTTTVSFAACGSNTTTEAPATTSETTATVAAETTTETTEAAETMESVDLASMSYEDASSYLYDQQLGEFYDAYQLAFETDNVSERYALMAIAEAKLMESAVMLPIYSRGGMYAIGYNAPYTACYSLWGNDSDRQVGIILTNELVKAEDYNEMKAKWSELKGTGTYKDYVLSFLEEKGYTLADTYGYPYSGDPTTWDCLATSRQADTRAIVQTYDGLMEYDCEGTLQPALAESMEVSADGLTYTFKLREGVKWVDSQGREVADVVADDFVAGMQHMMDAQGGLEYLVDGKIAGATEYISGETSDFTTVGVKAVDDTTLEYTLVEPCSYFDTMLSYSIFAPMSRAYYESKGGKFGADYDSAAADYTYGKTSDDIAYCGPYLVTNATEKNTIVFKANPTYYNPDKLTTQSLVWSYNDGTDVTKTYNDVLSGILSGCNLNTSTVEIAKGDGNFDAYAHVTSTDATTFMGFYNINRAAFANASDETALVSAQTEEDKTRTAAAMKNVHFRRALSMATDRGSYNAQQVGEDLKYTSLRNEYTPWNFVSLAEDTTVAINGTDTTFPAGTYYGEIVQAQIDADGVKITVYDPSADNGTGAGDGFDGWYNVDNAVEELDQAIAELAEQGVTVDESNPIYIDVPYASNGEVYTNKANAYKQSIESALGGNVIVNLVASSDLDGWQYAGYYTDYGYEANYDMYDLSGWGPDYGDPSTYLDTFLPDFAGYMIKCIGIF